MCKVTLLNLIGCFGGHLITRGRRVNSVYKGRLPRGIERTYDFVRLGLRTTFVAALAIFAVACGEVVEPRLVATSGPETTPAAIAETVTAERTQAPVTSTAEETAAAASKPLVEATPALTSEATTVPEPTSTPEPTREAPSRFNLGDTVEFGDLRVTVHAAWTTMGDGQLFKPEEGKHFVYVDVSFRNEGDKPLSLSTLIQMELRDGAGRKYAVDLGAIAAGGGASPDGEVAPGDILRGEVGYAVPTDATGLTWRFTGGLLDLGQAIFDLGKIIPLSETTPSAISETTAAEPTREALSNYSVGDTVEFGDLRVTVHAIRTSMGDGQLFKPEEGKYFVYVDVSFRNEGDKPESLSTLLQMELRDGAGRKYAVDLGAIAAGGGAAPDGEVAPGDVLRGEVGYAVPTDVSGLTWRFSGGLLDSGQAIFGLGDVTPPAS